MKPRRSLYLWCKHCKRVTRHDRLKNATGETLLRCDSCGKDHTEYTHSKTKDKVR